MRCAPISSGSTPALRRQTPADREPGGFGDDLKSHRHLVPRYQVPDAPELTHVRRRTQRNANVAVESRTGRPDENVVLPEVLTDFDGGTTGIQHHEIGLRINRPQHPRVRLVEELLPVVDIPSRAHLHVIDVIERRDGCLYG